MALVRRGLAESRERAQAMILAGLVYREEVRLDKPSVAVTEADALTVRGAPHPYVSRGGLKLEKAIGAFCVPVRDTVAMDVGASTGGFTDVLLRNGAKRVYAVDVGYGQLDWRLRQDPRVTVMERTNARHLTPDDFPVPPSLAVMDVSFISVRLILPALVRILVPPARIVTLVKPQFEAGRESVGKKGVVRDPAMHQRVLSDVVSFARDIGWVAVGADYSPVTGPEGNIEFLLDLLPETAVPEPFPATSLASVVQAAHKAFG